MGIFSKKPDHPLADLKLAQEGFVLNDGDVAIMAGSAKAFADQPNVATIFLHDGKPWVAGEVFIQKNLANTLKQISARGPDAFYKGPIADALEIGRAHV